jgi:hypothetical protein
MIRQHRMGELNIKAKPRASVQVEQIRHEFWFGAAISSSAFSGGLNSEDERLYKEGAGFLTHAINCAVVYPPNSCLEGIWGLPLYLAPSSGRGCIFHCTVGGCHSCETCPFPDGGGRNPFCCHCGEQILTCL